MTVKAKNTAETKKKIEDTEKKEKAENSKKGNKTKESVFETLSGIDVTPYLSSWDVKVKKGSKKDKLSYLSWAKAWDLVKKAYPKANYKIVEFPEYLRDRQGNWLPTGRTLDYRHTNVGYEVEVIVIIEDQQYSSKLFVMDSRNNAKFEKVTYFDINKTQQRALVKALAYAGLGLNVYSGEDFDEPAAQAPKETIPETNQNIFELTTDQLKKYKVTVNGQTGLLVDLYKSARKGNSGASVWLSQRHDPQTNRAIKQLNDFWLALPNDKKQQSSVNKQPTSNSEPINNIPPESEPINNIPPESDDLANNIPPESDDLANNVPPESDEQESEDINIFDQLGDLAK